MTEYERRYAIIQMIETLMKHYSIEMNDELYLLSVGNGSLEKYLLFQAKYKKVKQMRDDLLTLDQLEF